MSDSVFILTHGEYSDTVIDSIWTSLALAEKRLEAIKRSALSGDLGSEFTVTECTIEEHHVDRILGLMGWREYDLGIEEDRDSGPITMKLFRDERS